MKNFLAALTLVASGGLARAEVLQDFELGQGDWFADNGAWEVGTPSVGPPACHQGDECAGTVLDGNYPGTSTRLVSAPVLLDQGSVLDPLLLRFWHWFQWSTFATPDRGVVQVSVFDPGLSTWSDWTDVSSVFSGSSGVWTLNLVDLTAYSEQIVRIGFLHQGNLSSLSGAGWYVDDVEIPGTGLPSAPVTPWQDFEMAQGDWFADNGAWEVGTPSVGPAACHQGNECAGTVLDGSYPGTSTRLVSPPVLLDQGSVLDPLLLRFWHWFQWSTFATPDRGVVQVSVFDPGLSTWSDWTDVSSVFSGSSGVWTLNLVDLTAYSEQIVRIGFLHRGNLSSLSGAGWYVDDIEIPGTTSPPGVVTPWQDFEAGQGDWFADNGAWEVGTPSVGPPACHEGNVCAGTVLDGNYPGTSSRLISPSMLLGKGSVLEPLMLRFWHWFQWSTFATPDRGVVQVSVFDSGLSTWSDWTDVSSVFSGSSGVWTLNLVDLTAYSEQIVRIGFLHRGNLSSLSGAGWYVDDIGIQTGANDGDLIFIDSFESGQFR